jgi:hypothetical protein
MHDDPIAFERDGERWILAKRDVYKGSEWATAEDLRAAGWVPVSESLDGAMLSAIRKAHAAGDSSGYTEAHAVAHAAIYRAIEIANKSS